MTVAEILKEKKIPYTKTTDKIGTGYELEEVGGQIYENKDGIRFLYSNTEVTVPKRFGYLAELVEAYSQGAEPFMEAKAKYLGRNYKNGDKCTTVLDREFAKEEGICIWDSQKNSLEDFDRINDCIAKSFNENYMTIALNEIRQVQKGIKGFKDEERFNSANEPSVHSEYHEFFSRLGVFWINGVSKRVYIDMVAERPVLFAKQLYKDEEGQEFFSRTCIIAPSLGQKANGNDNIRLLESKNRNKIIDTLLNNGFLYGEKSLQDGLQSVPKACYHTGIKEFAKLYGITVQLKPLEEQYILDNAKTKESQKGSLKKKTPNEKTTEKDNDYTI